MAKRRQKKEAREGSDRARSWAEWCAQAHQRPLPLAVLDEIEVLERDGVPEDDEDEDE